MNEFNALGDERYSPVGIASAGSILQIPLDGIAHLRELHADLMLAPGDKIHLDDAVAVACGNGSVAQLSPLGVGVRGFAGERFVHAPVGAHMAHQRALGLLRLPLHHSPISLVNAVISEHLVEACKSLGGSGKDHQPAYRTVDAVYYSAEDVARFIVFLLQILLHHLRQRTVARAVPLHDLSGTLVDHNYMIVFIYYFHDWEIKKKRAPKKGDTLYKIYNLFLYPCGLVGETDCHCAIQRSGLNAEVSEVGVVSLSLKL